MAEGTYWLWNGGEVEGPVALSTLLEKSVTGQLGPDTRVMPTDAQEWVTVDRIGLGATVARVFPASEEIQPSVPTKKSPAIIQAVSQALAALVVGVGVVFAGIAKFGSLVKGLAVGTAAVTAHDGRALEGVGSKAGDADGTHSFHPPHAEAGRAMYDWYMNHEALINELLLLGLCVALTVWLDRVLTRSTNFITRARFRTIVGLSLFFLMAQLGSFFLQPLPRPLVAFTNAPENSMSVSSTIIECSALIALLVSYGGLFLLKRWARLIFACVVGISLVTDIFSGPLVEPASAQIFGSLFDLFSGIVLAIAYLTPLFSSPIIQANPTTPVEEDVTA